MSNFTLISTFCLLIVGATGMPLDQADQLRVNVNVNVRPKTQAAAEANLLAPRMQKLTDKLEKGSSIESDVQELVQEAQNGGDKKNEEGEEPNLKKRIFGEMLDKAKNKVKMWIGEKLGIVPPTPVTYNVATDDYIWEGLPQKLPPAFGGSPQVQFPQYPNYPQ